MATCLQVRSEPRTSACLLDVCVVEQARTWKALPLVRVLICGSRDFAPTYLIKERIDRLPEGAEVIHGGARGADSIAALYSVGIGLRVRSFPADWKRLGRRAGIVRNIEMLGDGPDLVIAFWDGKSRGTKHTITEARRLGIKVEVIPPA